jgi:site-specific DNA-methyltransferase (adenine-specific)
MTDPPYGMGMEEWDHSVPSQEIWEEVYRVLKPGGFCLSFCSPQLYHRMATAVDDAGFNIKDQIMWMVTTKMPKKNRLKPAHEPIVVAQKPFKGSIEKNFQEWGVGKIDVEETRVPWDGKPPTGWVKSGHLRRTFGKEGKTTGSQKEFGKVDANPDGRYPSNIIGEVLPEHQKYFYAPRVTRKERGDYNDHPTPKPIALMSYLVKIYCPPNGIVLDPFCGSGSTGIGALLEGRKFCGIDLDEHYIEISKRRIQDHVFSTQAKPKTRNAQTGRRK